MSCGVGTAETKRIGFSQLLSLQSLDCICGYLLQDLNQQAHKKTNSWENRTASRSPHSFTYSSFPATWPHHLKRYSPAHRPRAPSTAAIIRPLFEHQRPVHPPVRPANPNKTTVVDSAVIAATASFSSPSAVPYFPNSMLVANMTFGARSTPAPPETVTSHFPHRAERRR